MDMQGAYDTLKAEFVKGYEAGYIDDNGYILDNITIGDYADLKRRGMVRKTDDGGLKISPPLSSVRKNIIGNIAEIKSTIHMLAENHTDQFFSVDNHMLVVKSGGRTYSICFAGNLVAVRENFGEDMVSDLDANFDADDLEDTVECIIVEDY